MSVAYLWAVDNAVPGSPRRGPDPRQLRTQRRVFEAARVVLRREGMGGTTMDAIAAEAAVARSTLYRNWASRDELLAAAFDDLVEAPASPDGAAPVRDQLLTVLVGLARGLERSEWGRTLPAVVAAIEAEPVLATRYGRLTDERRAAAVAIVERAVASGELPAGLSAPDLIDALVGPLFYRRLVRQIATDPAWVERHLDRTLSAFQPS